MNNIVLLPIPKDELVNDIVCQLYEKLTKNHSLNNSTISEEELIKPVDTAQLFKVSLVTINQWTKEGKLKAYRIGRRKFYKRSEVLEALQSTMKYSRKG